jgi:hypothetical protein
MFCDFDFVLDVNILQNVGRFLNIFLVFDEPMGSSFLPAIRSF